MKKKDSWSGPIRGMAEKFPHINWEIEIPVLLMNGLCTEFDLFPKVHQGKTRIYILTSTVRSILQRNFPVVSLSIYILLGKNCLETGTWKSGVEKIIE